MSRKDWELDAKIHRDGSVPPGTVNATYPAQFHSYYPSPLADPEVYQAVYRREMQRVNRENPNRLVIQSSWGQFRIPGLCLRCRSNPTGLPRAGYCVACQEHIGKVWRRYGRIRYGHNALGGVTAPVVGSKDGKTN